MNHADALAFLRHQRTGTELPQKKYGHETWFHRCPDEAVEVTLHDRRLLRFTPDVITIFCVNVPGHGYMSDFAERLAWKILAPDFGTRWDDGTEWLYAGPWELLPSDPTARASSWRLGLDPPTPYRRPVRRTGPLWPWSFAAAGLPPITHLPPQTAAQQVVDAAVRASLTHLTASHLRQAGGRLATPPVGEACWFCTITAPDGRPLDEYADAYGHLWKHVEDGTFPDAFFFHAFRPEVPAAYAGAPYWCLACIANCSRHLDTPLNEYDQAVVGNYLRARLYPIAESLVPSPLLVTP